MTNQRDSQLRKRRQRGAALVEAVVIIPFFIIIFASMIFVGQLYGEKQRTLREAKQNAWVYAMGNCQGSTSDVSSESDGDPMNQLQNNDPNVDPNQTQQFSGSDPGMAKLQQDMGTAVATSTGTVTASKGIGGFSNKLSTTTRVQCNEAPIDGNLFGVFKFAWNLFKKW
jgi:Flp pilus assembly protein TadG